MCQLTASTIKGNLVLYFIINYTTNTGIQTDTTRDRERQRERQTKNLSGDSQQSMTVSLLVLTTINGNFSFISSVSSAVTFLMLFTELNWNSFLLRMIRLLNATSWHTTTFEYSTDAN